MKEKIKNSHPILYDFATQVRERFGPITVRAIKCQEHGITEAGKKKPCSAIYGTGAAGNRDGGGGR